MTMIRRNRVLSAIALAASMLLALTGAAVPAAAQAPETRVALVVGNAAYKSAGALANPANDARLMATSLKSAGFTVALLLDADQAAMKRAMVEFGRALRSSDAVGLFYYAGHGMQVNGLNYLVPVDANVTDETEVGIETVSLSDFLATMERAKNRINLVVLDACRNNPFARSFRSGTAGLARVDAPSGTFVAYATAPGAVAADGTTGNSPYTKALGSVMLKPGLPIEQTFKEVQRAVLEETGGQQTPWEASSITGDFYFVRGTGPVQPVPVPSAADAARDKELELAFWNSMKDTTNTALLRSYLQQYPRGTFVAIAKTRIEELERKPAPSPSQAGDGAKQPSVALGTGARPPAAIFADSARRQLTDQELMRLGCDQLWRARNEMFARNGYCFATPEAQAVFGTKGCTTTRQDVLSSVEVQNLRLIRAAEARKSCGPITTTASAPAPGRSAVPSAGNAWHFVTGLDPRGDNFLALKVAPDVRSERLAKMGPDTLLKILGTQGDWRRVQLQDGRIGWAHGRYIACCKQGP